MFSVEEAVECIRAVRTSGCPGNNGERKGRTLLSDLDLRAATGTTCPFSPKAVFPLYDVEGVSGYLITAYSCTSLPLILFVVSKLTGVNSINFQGNYASGGCSL